MKTVALICFLSLSIVWGREGTARYVPGQMIVKFAETVRNVIPVNDGNPVTSIAEIDRLNKEWGVDKIQRVLSHANPDVLDQELGLDLYYVFYFPPKTDINAIIAPYQSIAGIEEVFPNWLRSLSLTNPSDPKFQDQWHLPKIEAPAAWDVTKGDKSVIVAQIDNGVEYTHDDLEGNLWINTAEDMNHDGKFTTADNNGVDEDGNDFIDDVIGWDFYHDDNDPKPGSSNPWYDPHGTVNFGIETAVTDNSLGVSGVGWKCRGMAIKVGEGGGIDIVAAANGIHYAGLMGACALGLSYGGPYFTSLESSFIQYAHRKGAVICAAAGNDNITAKQYPACYENVLAVAASNKSDRKSMWAGGQGSNYGTWIDLCAPGDDIMSTALDNSYEGPDNDGTSMAAPIVAGVAALVKAAHPGWSNTQIEQALLNTCDPMPDDLYDQGLLGHGRVNAAQAVNYAIGLGEPEQKSRDFLSFRSYPNPFRGGSRIQFELPFSDHVVLCIYNSTGQLIRVLVDETRPAGRSTIHWDGTDRAGKRLPAGVYFFKLTMGNQSKIHQAVILK